MPLWTPPRSGLVNLVRLDSVRGKILIFALLATLIPAVTMGWQSYVLNRRYITEKISEELSNATFHTVREFNLWLRERVYEMRVFSSSYEVTENLERILRAPDAEGGLQEARRRLTDYVRSVRGKFPDYEELMVVGPSGDALVSSVDQAGVLSLPSDWSTQAKADAAIVGTPYWDEELEKGVIVVGVAIRAPSGRFLGLMAGRLNFGTVEQLLRTFSIGRTGRVYLIDREGVVIVSSQATPAGFMHSRLPPQIVQTLVAREQRSEEYESYQGDSVRGSLRPVPELNWGVVAEISQEEAYAQTERIRDLTLLLVAALLVAIGLTAYLVALTIVRPLDRLRAGAAKVAAGDLEVDLPGASGGEIGYLTQVFNYMVTRLRQGREELAAANAALSERNKELEQLSITDGLTGLHNRKHLMETLTTEVARARRHKHPFSVVMIDIDHFKHYNDTYGHLAGDRLLTRIAELFRAETRNIDYAARYGGEEFLLMLTEVGPDGAAQAATRIRQRVAGGTGGPGREPVTVSLGVASFPDSGSTPEALIASADAALYEAKRQGRNRVVLANSTQATA